MNRIELGEAIKAEAASRNVTVTRVDIYNRAEHLDVNVSYVADCRCHWVSGYTVDGIVADVMPVERPWRMRSMNLDRPPNRFSKGETVEMDGLWVYISPDEDEKDVPIKVGSGCGRYREGWVTGKVVETPSTLDVGAYEVVFDRTVWVPPQNEWIGSVTRLEEMIRDGRMKEFRPNHPVSIGSARPEIRLVACGVRSARTGLTHSGRQQQPSNGGPPAGRTGWRM